MKYYCIKLIKDTYSCVVLDKSFIQLTYHESLLFNSFDELLVFFKNKNDICISIFQSDFINTSIVYYPKKNKQLFVKFNSQKSKIKQ